MACVAKGELEVARGESSDVTEVRSSERGPLGEPMSVRSGRKEENRLERRLMEEFE